MDETRLVHRAQEGDETVLGLLYHYYLNDIYRYIYMRTGTRADAEDLTSETFLRMLKNLHQYREEGTFRNWLLGIARHVVNDFWRYHYSVDEISMSPEVFAESLSPDSEAFFRPFNNIKDDNVQEQEELRSFVKILLEGLPTHYRRTLELRFLEGKSVRETAQAMHCTESNVKVRQHRALKKLAQATTEVKVGKSLRELITGGVEKDE